MRPDTYHLVIHVAIFNSNNQMLIQKRRHDKIGAPNMWDISAGGSAPQVKRASSVPCVKRRGAGYNN